MNISDSDVDINDAENDIPSTLSPDTCHPSGRPKKKRDRNSPEREEENLKKIYRCGRCNKVVGHNKKTCRDAI